MDSLTNAGYFLRSLMVLGALAAQAVVAQSDSTDLLDLSIEELSNLRITSASRIEENLRDAPASVFVITRDEIRRTGVTSIPEALRLAPGVEVARRSAFEWSISIRGFNSDLANKLLVLIDGRSVYSPLFAGVFWDVQDVLLEDVDRIEVVSGPGGTLWGENAVNGVINIITRPAGETEGGYFEALAGDEERLIAGIRRGGRLGEHGAGRVWLKHVDRGPSEAPNGDDSVDAMQMTRAGVRLDFDAGASDRYLVEGEVYAGNTDGVFQDAFTIGTLPAGSFRDEVDLDGAHLLARWERPLGERSGLRLQAYFDRTVRNIPNVYDERRDTWDLDFQHHLRIGARHNLVWGLAYRATSDQIDNTTFATFLPASRSTQRYGGFVQDRIALVPERLVLTVGTKLGDNDYTGFEYQPNFRLAWHPDGRQTLWAAASRAIRIPSRLDDDLVLTVPLAAPGIPIPFYVVVSGNDGVRAERLVALEAGYRLQPGDNLSFDVAAFRNDYDRLVTNEPDEPFVVVTPPVHVIVPSHFENDMKGKSWGGTLAVNWHPTGDWRMRLQYAFMDLDLEVVPPGQDVNSPRVAGNSPRHQLALHSFLDLRSNVSLYAGLRYVDELPNQDVASYVATDVNLVWRFRPRVELALAVQNLTDDTHPEFENRTGSLIERSAYLRLQWDF